MPTTIDESSPRRRRRFSREHIRDALLAGEPLDEDDLVQWHEASVRTVHEVTVRDYLRTIRQR
jgi:hypothetical protein